MIKLYLPLFAFTWFHVELFLHLTFFPIELICISHSSMLSFFSHVTLFYVESFCISHSSVLNFFAAWTFCTHPLSVQLLYSKTYPCSPLLSHPLDKLLPKCNFFFFFFFRVCNDPIWLAHPWAKKEGFILICRIPPLWPTYVGERRTTFAKAYEINVRCYWELSEEHVRNFGTLSFDPCLTPKKHTHGKSTFHCPSGKSTFHCPSGKWTADRPLSTPKHNLKKVPSLTRKKKKGGPFTPWHDF